MKFDTLLRCLTFLSFIHIVFDHESFAQCMINRPHPSVTSFSSCDITIHWHPVNNAAYYKVEYKVSGAAQWNVVSGNITDTTYTFTGLLSSIKYKLAVGAFCANNTTSGFKTITRSTLAVTVPQTVIVSQPSGTTVTVSWTAHCSTQEFNLRYKQSQTATWTVIKSITSSPYVVDSLHPNTDYDFSIQGQNGNHKSQWSATVSANSGNVTVPKSRPNFIVYLMDDARYDQFKPNGGPSWFNTPAIDQIANEGINFVYTFPTTSECAPSRVSFYSGLYASKHGAIDNMTRHFPNIPLISQILQSAGYYTGFVGKYGQAQNTPEGFNWWATSNGDIYMNADYTINGVDTVIQGHITDVYQNLAMTFLNTVPQGKKFLLFFNTRVPHEPTVPRDQDLSLYLNDTVPFPGNFYKYSVNYPSYFYSGHRHLWPDDSLGTVTAKLSDFQCLYGAEVNMEALLNWLTGRGILDSTFIVFTSDNGNLEGEHKLSGKQIAQEESIRIPLFIRYPAWFTGGTIDSLVMANNIDVPASFLAAAGIPDTFGMDGVSLKDLESGAIKRNYFYYQFADEGYQADIRAVRSSQYIYVKHFCAQTTEEFYDLVNDPKENVNEINNSAYASLIQNYRLVLDSIKTALGDADPPAIACSLANPQYQRESDARLIVEETKLTVYPDPASEVFTIDFSDDQNEDLQVWVKDMLNEQFYYKAFPNTNSFRLLVSSEDWPKGVYDVIVRKGKKNYASQFIVQ